MPDLAPAVGMKEQDLDLQLFCVAMPYILWLEKRLPENYSLFQWPPGATVSLEINLSLRQTWPAGRRKLQLLVARFVL